MKILLLYGANALEPPADAVLEQIPAALRNGGHEVEMLAIADQIAPIVTRLQESQPELIFNLTESFNEKSALDSNLAALLNLLGLRYTGSSPSGLIQAGDKSLCKKILSFHKIRTPQFATLYRGALDHAAENLHFPVIVKPPQEDASIGITENSVVADLSSLLNKMNELQDLFQSPILVEEFVAGREFYVGMLGNVNVQPLPVIELDFSNDPDNLHRIASFEVKWDAARDKNTESIFPTDLPKELEERMQKVAVEAFQALRLRDYARVDLRVNDAGEIFVIEVNPNCYLERNSEFARSAQQAGIDYDALIARIVELAAARYAR